MINIKKFLKNNKVSLIIFFILIIWALSVAIPIKNNVVRSDKRIQELIENCKIDPYINSACENIETIKSTHLDTYSQFSQLVVGESLSYLQILAPLIVIVATIGNFHSKLKSGFFKNELMRMDYKSWLNKNIKSSLSVIWILPLFIIIVFIISYWISGNLSLPPIPKCETVYSNVEKDYIQICEGTGFLFGTNWIKVMPLFVIVFLINIILNSIMYVNIALISCKKNRNVVVSAIVAYLTYIVLNIIIEVFIGGILFSKILKIHNISTFLGLSEYWVYENKANLILTVIYYLSLVIISYSVLKITYKDKERVIIESEK